MADDDNSPTTTTIESAGVEAQVEPRGSGGGWRRGHLQGRRSRAVLVRLSPEEHAEIDQLAAAVGVSIPRLLLEAVHADRSGSVTERASDRRALAGELVGIRRLLHNLSNNLNQLARAANAGYPPAAAPLAAELDLLRRLGRRLDEAAPQLPKP